MFHSVGNTAPVWYRNWLSVDLTHFEELCKYLMKNDYKTILLDEWHYLENNLTEQTGREIVLTFDDGYLDNWVYAYPILKKYGLQGTIFINPEFVDPTANIRFNLDDVFQNKMKKEELVSLGFMNWAEIIEADKSGVLDVQSHSMSHNFYFHSDKIVDFYDAQPQYDWLAWISNSEKKPFYLTEDQTKLTKIGTPIFEFYLALGLRRYFPDKELEKIAIENFQKMTKIDLLNFLNGKKNDFPGRFETDEEMEERYRYELFESKRILEEKLNKKVEFLCWPGGGYNELSIRLSIEAGYKASTFSSREKSKIIDNSGTHKRIQRFGIGSFVTTKKSRRFVRNKKHLVYNYLGRSGSTFYKYLNRSRKLWCMILDIFK
jgi:peptidoglycan/xylan/chitin deacetylase (PgdA/CDA1 family)